MFMENLLCISLFNLHNYPKSVLSLAPFSQMKKLNISLRKTTRFVPSHKTTSNRGKFQTQPDSKVQPLNHCLESPSPTQSFLPSTPGKFLLFLSVLFSVNEISSPLQEYSCGVTINRMNRHVYLTPSSKSNRSRVIRSQHSARIHCGKNKRSKVCPENSDSC